MIDPLKKSTGSRWRNSWHRYAEFLRENGRRPVHERYKERSLYVWYSNNRSKLDNGLLYKELVPSFLKLTDEGDTYRFYVVNRERNIQMLAFLGSENNISGSEVNDDRKVSFIDTCKMYVDFCNRLERPPLMEIKEEKEIAKWFFKAKDDFTNSRLMDKEMSAFDRLLQSTKQYENDNVTNHVSELHESNLNEEGKNEVLNANDGTESHMGAWERNWYKMRDRYSKYLDDNKKVPRQNGDGQLYDWIYRQKKLLARGDIEDNRKAALKKLLAKIEDVRKNQVDEANKKKERKQSKKEGIILDGKHTIVTKSAKPRKVKRKAVKQDDLWNHRWQAYMGYMKKNQFCPSRYYTEDMVLFSWFKHNKMLLSKGKMREYRIAKFKQLLDEVKELQRKNKDIINADNRKGFHIRARQRNWFEMCERYSKYLDDNKKVPKQNGDRQLYSWMFRQKRHLAEGDIEDDKKTALEKLLAKIEVVRKYQVDEANKRKEEIILDRKHAAATKTAKPKKSERKAVKQDDLWNQKWQAYKDFMEKNKRCPSKHHAEELVLFDWFKHNKKLLKRGKMREDRIAKFTQLYGEAEDLQRKNNNRYSNAEVGAKPTEEAKAIDNNNKNISIDEDKPTTEVHIKRKKRNIGIHLYDYQEEMLSRVETEFQQHRSLMVQMPTGTGKTYLLVAVVSDFIRNIGGHVWIVTHRRELVQQVKATIRKFKALVDDATDIEKHATVYSIQWLTRHYGEVEEKPGMIIIDEAHHAVAKTYSSVINAFPQSKILGLTATPCRLNAQPFTDLFEELLQSWTIGEFIAKKYLSLYDYMSVRPSSADVKIINGLNGRGADGDFSVREMAEKLDIRPSLQRLCDTVLRYAKNKKGIVYAINIQHAEHIAEFYCENGIKAEAVSNKTPARKRNDILKRFKETPTDGARPLRDDDIQVIVNVELFDEGWDVPDAEFIQLARPTLSLSKYLQMVGRGLRVYGGKKFCIILDNVGSYRLFGLPSDERDWERMFEGKLAGKGMVDENSLSDQFDNHDYVAEVSDDSDTDMMMLLDHSGLSGDLKENFGYKIVKGRKGLYGVVDKDGNEVIPCKHGKITLRPNAIAQLFDKDGSETDDSWIDLISGVRFQFEPSVTRKDSLELTTRDKFKFYPRVKSKWMNSETYTLREILNCGVDDGLRFRNFYVQPSEPRKLYKYVERIDNKTLYIDEDENYFVRTDYEQPLKKTTLEEWKEDKQSRKDELSATGLDDGGEWYWNWASDYRKNGGKTVKIGFLEFTEKEGGYQYNYDTSKISFRRDEFIVPHLIRRQIRMREDICFLGDNYIVTKSRPHVLFHIYQRYIDGRRFDVEFYAYPSMRYYCRRLYYDGNNPPIVGNSEIRDASDVDRERSDKRWKKLREEMQ